MYIVLDNNIVVGWGTGKPDEGVNYVESEEPFEFSWIYNPVTKKFSKPDNLKFNDIRVKIK